ncbi:MAG: hypothetical protein R3C11_29595 [Planctomycetaceae bacterium]
MEEQLVLRWYVEDGWPNLDDVEVPVIAKEGYTPPEALKNIPENEWIVEKFERMVK